MGHTDAVIAGGGVIGLAAAFLAARDGLEVTVVDPNPGAGASWAAAGMLAPVTEVHYNEEALLELNLRAAEAWPAFAADLLEVSGCDAGYRPCGTLAVAANEGDRIVSAHPARFTGVESAGLFALGHALNIRIGATWNNRAHRAPELTLAIASA